MRINYYYDTAGRLRFVQHENLNTDSVSYSGVHTLNNRGNIVLTREYFTPLPLGHNTNTGNSATNTYGYDNNSQITTGNGDSYNVDDDGNTTTFGQNNSLNYDIDDRLILYTDVDNSFSFKYNPYNQRVEATRNGVNTKYVRDVRLDNILVELDSNNNPIQYFIYAPNGMLLCRMIPNGELNYYHGDIRGSVVMITDDSANITHQYRYDDFGSLTRWSEPNNNINPFKYVGIYGVEYETNDLYYMRARYYKPSIGRFLSEDPIWSTNLYPYADNNPISKVDPKGEIAYQIYKDCKTQSEGAVLDFFKNFIDMHIVDFIDGDKYFHAKANFQATNRGDCGKFTAIILSELREILDLIVFGNYDKKDQEANRYGREQAKYYSRYQFREALDKHRPKHEKFPNKY